MLTVAAAAAAILLLYVGSAHAQFEDGDTCCVPNFHGIAYGPSPGAPHNVTYDAETGIRLATSFSEDVAILMYPPEARVYFRMGDFCTYSHSPFLQEVPQACLKKKVSSFNGEVNLEGVKHYSWTQTLPEVTENAVLTAECHPKIVHLSSPDSTDTFAVLFNLRTIEDASETKNFNRTGCVPA